MQNPAESISAVPTQQPNDFAFEKWIRSNAMTVAVSTAAALIASVSPVVAAIYRAFNAPEPGGRSIVVGRLLQHGITSLYILETGLLAIAIIWTFKTRHVRDKAAEVFPKEARDTVKAFSDAWLIVVMVWLAENSAYAIQAVLTGVVPHIGPKLLRGIPSENLFPGFLMTVVELGEAAAIFWAHTILSVGRRQNAQLNFSGYPALCLFSVAGVGALMTSSLLEGQAAIVTLLAVQLLVALSLALLAGRVDSRFIDAPFYIVQLIYGYALLQVAFPLLEAILQSSNLFHPAIAAQGLVFAFLMAFLVLKVILILFVSWLLETGKLHRYVCVVRIANSINSLVNDNDFLVRMARIHELEEQLAMNAASGSSIDHIPAPLSDEPAGPVPERKHPQSPANV